MSSLAFQNYSKKIQEKIKNLNLDVLDKISIKKGSRIYQGLLMDRYESGDPNCIVIKLDNGYNIGIEFDKNTKIEKLEDKKKIKVDTLDVSPKKDKKKKNISILATGGTIASKIDYRTGGVSSAFSAEEIISAVPEIKDIANIKGKLITQLFSEDINPSHYTKLANEIKKEIDSGADGIVVTHGTDTLHYTACALSFIFQDLNIPIVLVGAQRSSDRGSSDAAINLIHATKVASSNISEVCVVMHATPNDTYSFIHKATKVRKMHTSRRDAFKSINIPPLGKVDKKIEFFNKDFKRRDKNRKLEFRPNLDQNVALIKIAPGIKPSIFKYVLEEGYRGLILEGTGLGHLPINVSDEFTKINKEIYNFIKKLCENNIIVGMSSQCLYGRVNMNVYSTGRDLKKLGVISCEDMLPEVAYIKLMWALGQYRESKKVKEIMRKNLCGEIAEKRFLDEF